MAEDPKDKGKLPVAKSLPGAPARVEAAVTPAPAPSAQSAKGAANAMGKAPKTKATSRARTPATTPAARAVPVPPAPAAAPAPAVLPAPVIAAEPVPVLPVVTSPEAAAPAAPKAFEPPVAKPVVPIQAEPVVPAPAEPVAPMPAEPVTAEPVNAEPVQEKPVVATGPGTVTPHAKAAAPIKTRVTHAAAPAAARKEQSLMTTASEFSEKFQSAFKDASEKAKAAFEKSQAAFGDAGEFAKGNVEAMVESSKILASGLQELTKGYVSEGKTAMESFTAEIKELAAAKSPTEFFEKHNALMRKQFDAAVAASSKHSEAVLKLANEAFQPISNRVSIAVEKIKHAA